jgi:hypothetical protein
MRTSPYPAEYPILGKLALGIELSRVVAQIGQCER